MLGGENMFVKGEVVESVEAANGVSRKLLSRGGGLMMTEVTFDKAAIGDIHYHIHEQISYIVQGSFEFNLDGEKKVVQKGDSIFIPSNAPHGVKALEQNSIILDIFTPQRDDFL